MNLNLEIDAWRDHKQVWKKKLGINKVIENSDSRQAEINMKIHKITWKTGKST